MMGSRFFGSLTFGWYMHWLFATILLVGVVLLIVWMVKNLDKKALLSWIIVLLAVGFLGSLFTMNVGVRGWEYMMNNDVDFDEMMDWNGNVDYEYDTDGLVY